VIATVNPATNQTLRVFDPLSQTELDQRIARAWAACLTHRRTSFADRAGWMMRAAEIPESEKQRFGELMTLEMGKPLKAAIEDAAKCATGCRYYAENAERFLADETIETGAVASFDRYQPIGPVLAVMPWNFPSGKCSVFLRLP
jgi:succinate-semialdehyde dehydrogenase/glutarate-semialdehyde dehydrogenase